jgi:calcineurin-like phosphoesterase
VVKVSEKKPAKVVLVDTVEEDPALASGMPMFATKSDKITVKVFDIKGALVMNQEVSMNEFLAKDKKAALPANSTFVMFHANTAYYFLEAGLAN